MALGVAALLGLGRLGGGLRRAFDELALGVLARGRCVRRGRARKQAHRRESEDDLLHFLPPSALGGHAMKSVAAPQATLTDRKHADATLTNAFHSPPERGRRGSDEALDAPQDSAAVLLQQGGELPERALPPDMPDDFLQLVLRKAGLLRRGGHRVPRSGVRLAERGDRLLDLVGGEANLGREVLHGRVVGDLAEKAIQKAHRGSPYKKDANSAPGAGIGTNSDWQCEARWLWLAPLGGRAHAKRQLPNTLYFFESHSNLLQTL